MTKGTARFARFVAVAAILALGLMPAVAGASPLLVEQFNYPNGNLVGNGGWTNHSGTGFFIQVNGGEVLLSQGGGSREDANVPLSATRGATDKTYVALLVTVPSATTLTSPDYFAHFRSAAFAFPARIYIAPPTGGGNFTFGLSGTSTGTTPVVFWGSDFAFGSTHLVVASYDAADGSTQLWVDPMSEASPSIVSAGGVVGDLISTYALRQGGTTTSEQIIGGILVGTTFADVVGGVVPVESASWGDVKSLFR